MKNEIKMPFSTMKKLLLFNSELRSDKETVQKFTKIVIEMATEKAKQAQERCVANKRKTLRSEDL